MVTNEIYMSDLAIPPGEYLEEVLVDSDISQAELARRMGRPKQAINEIIKGSKAITADTALQLEQVLGVSAKVWSVLEAEYRLVLAKHQQAEEVKKEESLVKEYPYNFLRKLGLVRKAGSIKDKVIELRKFFGVSSLFNIENVKEYEPAFRVNENHSISQESLAAWLRAGHLLAEREMIQPYAKEKLENSLEALRTYTHIVEPNEMINTVKDTLGECGVSLTLVPAFPKTCATGATYWAGKSNPIIVMSMRGAWSDIFWFSLFHEIAHVLFHDKRVVFIERKNNHSEYQAQEEQADKFARNTLIPPKQYSHFVSGGDFSSLSIAQFAKKVGIFPGIVSGRLQFDGHIPYGRNYFRIRYKWNL